MSKYIIISVENVEDYKSELEKEKVTDEYEKFYLQGKLRAVATLLDKGKEISLDDESIKQKAKKVYPIGEDTLVNGIMQDAYVQALKDIRE